MSIRKKLLVVMLLVAVLPLALMRMVQAVSIYRLKDRVERQMYADLSAEAKSDLEFKVAGYAGSLERDSRLVMALLNAQANEVERRLASPEPGIEERGRVLSPQEFGRLVEQDPDELPELVISELHGLVQPNEDFSVAPVSFGQPVMLTFDSGAPAEDRRLAVAQLSTMTPAYRESHDQAPELILWQYTSLGVGVHQSYPGKANFSPDYNPLQRDWYQRTLEADASIRLRPLVDATTGQVITTFAKPVRNEQGQAVGVTAIDIPLSRVLDRDRIDETWADQARLMLVTPYRPTGTALTPEASGDSEMDGLYILADLDDDYRVLQMRQAGEIVALKFRDDQLRTRILSDFAAGRSGVIQTTVNGTDALLAYGRVTPRGERPAYLAILVPTAAVNEPAELLIDEIDAELTASLVYSGVAIGLLLIIVVVVAWYQARRISAPIIEIAEVANRVANGDLTAQVTSCTAARELEQVGLAMNQMVPKLRDQIAVREALAVAMEVQQALLPEYAPTVPGLDIAGYSEYCDETGGDYYDFIELGQLDADTVAVAIGDVTGHGIAAALLMATGRALIRSRAAHVGSLEEVFSDVNAHLCENRFAGRFMTLFYMLIDVKPKGQQPPISVRYLAAGHDPTLVYRPTEDRFLELKGKDIPLGIDAGWSFTEITSDDFKPGDILVAGTDGIWECFNRDQQQFGKERLKQTIKAAAGGSAQNIIDRIAKAVQDWRGEEDQTDDVTMVVVKIDEA